MKKALIGLAFSTALAGPARAVVVYEFEPHSYGAYVTDVRGQISITDEAYHAGWLGSGLDYLYGGGEGA